MGSTGSIKVSDFVAIYFPVYAFHSRANLPKGKAVSVCEISLNPNKMCEGNSLNFSLSTKGKVKGFPLARNSLLTNCWRINFSVALGETVVQNRNTIIPVNTARNIGVSPTP